MSITSECMVVNLQVGTWTGHRLDKEASRRVTEEAGAEVDAARVNKHLIPKEALKPIMTKANAIRTHFYDKTLPWKDNGDRLLTRKLYMPFIERHEGLVGEFNTEVEHFLETTYPKAKDQAAFRMGDLFDPDDYPRAADLRRKFYTNLDIDPVSEAGDFRVAMDQDNLDRVRRNIEQATKDRLGKAMNEVWTRLNTTLGHFAQKMGSDEIFRDSTVRNLQEIVDLLPDLNILNDPSLERIRLDIKSTLSGYEPKDLRTDEVARGVAASEAQRIMADMAGFMNAFGAQ